MGGNRLAKAALVIWQIVGMSLHSVSVYEKPPPISRTRYAWRRFVKRQLPTLVAYLLVATLIGVVLAPFMLITVPSGYVGVLWKRFGGGTVLDPRRLKAEGLRITLPWNRVFLYDLRLQSATETYNAISKDGISLTATINTRFRLKREAVPQLHQSIGPNYIRALIIPEIGNRTREVISEYTAEDVYSTKRSEIQNEIRHRAESTLGEKMMEGGEGEEEESSPYRIPLDAMLNLMNTLILGIELPAAVEAAINRKVEQYYISEEYKFRVAREMRESQRKRIEAEGISEFQQIVSQGISDSYLRWRGIEATFQLAQSNNPKVVIIGNGKEGPPIILGNVDTAITPAENGATAKKERTTAATPTIPSEKTPADTLSKPSEKAPSAQPSEAQRVWNPLPLTLSDLKALLDRIVAGSTPASSEAAKSDTNSKKPATNEQQQKAQ
jgi:regulator of protease activity HflC (stomatin/prohibitin superfamily)